MRVFRACHLIASAIMIAVCLACIAVTGGSMNKLCGGGYFAILILLGCIVSLKKDSHTGSIYRHLFIACFVALITQSIGRGFDTINVPWDISTIFHAPEQYIVEGKIYNEWDYYGGTNNYFMIYPNNRGMLIYMIGWFTIQNALGFAPGLECFQALSILSMAIGVFFVLRSAELYFKDRSSIRITELLVLTCVPLYLFGLITYSDALAFPYVSVACYLVLKNENEFSIVRLTALVIVLFIAFVFKPFIVAALIAYAIYMILKWKNIKALLQGVLAAVLFMALYMVFSYWTSHLSILDYSDEDQLKFPIEHWIMMGLNDKGIWTQEDYDYTISYPTLEEKKNADLEVIKSRIAERESIGDWLNLYHVKIGFLFTQPFMELDGFLRPISDYGNTIYHFLFETEGCRQYLIAWQCMLLVLVLFSMAGNLRRNGMSKMFILELAFLGEVMELMIWECHSRYLFHFYPALFLVAANGYGNLKAVLHKFRKAGVKAPAGLPSQNSILGEE